MQKVIRQIAVAVLMVIAVTSVVYGQSRAPKGGTYVSGKFYKGGQFLPGGSSSGSSFSSLSLSETSETEEARKQRLEAERIKQEKQAKEQEVLKTQGKRGLAIYRAKQKSVLASGTQTQNVIPVTSQPLVESDATKNIFGKVVGVTDGDTITVYLGKDEPVKVRLEGIDAPETKQDLGSASKKHLSELVFGKDVMVQVTGKDKYKRTLGFVFVDGQNVNKTMISNGLAWHYKQYNSDPALDNAEKAARGSRLGIWSIPNQIPPWEFRHK